MEPYYLKRHGSFATRIIIALDCNEVPVGRKATPELKNGPNVSRCHAMFLRACNGQWYVQDMKSTNGVFVNSVKIGSGLYTVNIGDIIGLGATSGDSERDYVFIMCNNRTLSLNSSAAGDNENLSGSSCTVPYNAKNGDALPSSKRDSLPVVQEDNVSSNCMAVQIKKEVVEEEHDIGEKSENNHVSKTVNHVFIKKEKPESPVNNLCDHDLSAIHQNTTDSTIHQLILDSKLADIGKSLDHSIVKTPLREDLEHKNVFEVLNNSLKPSGSAVSQKTLSKGLEHKNFFEVSNNSLKPSDSVVSLKTVSEDLRHKNVFEVSNNSLKPSGFVKKVTTKTEKNDCPQSTSIQNINRELQQFSFQKELKVVLKKYDDIVVETYEIEKQSAENDTDSSCSDVVIPNKQRGHRQRINSSSSDESKGAFGTRSHKKVDKSDSLSSGKSSVDEKLCKVSSECLDIETRKDGGCEVPLAPVINSSATSNVISSLNTANVSSQCYTQEDEIIIISSDDDDYDYSKNPVPVKIKTEPVENDDLSNSEWQYVSNSQSVCEHDEYLSDLEVENIFENVLCSGSHLKSSALRTSLNTDDHHKDVGDGKAVASLQQEHTHEAHADEEDELLDRSENIENITAFLFNTSNNKSLPKKTLKGTNCGISSSKTNINNFSHQLPQPLLSDELKRSDASYSDHVQLEKKEKLQKLVSKSFKVPSISENKKKTLYAKISGESSNSSLKHVESSRSKHSETQEQSSKNFDRSYFSENHRFSREKKTDSSKNADDILNDFCKRQKEKTLSKTVLTEAMPIQYRSRYKRGREEWFRDQYEEDKPTENQEVSVKGIVQKTAENNSKNKTAENNSKNKTAENNSKNKTAENNSKNKTDTLPVRHKDGKSKIISKESKRKKSKQNKNSSLRDQMQNKYHTIPFRSKSSAPIVAPSSSPQAHRSAKEKNISFPVKRKLPADDTTAKPVKERRVELKKTERFNSRMSFLTDDIPADNTKPPNVDALRYKEKLPHLPDKSYQREASSVSDVDVPRRRKKSAKQPSVLEMNKILKGDRARNLSSDVHSENLLSDCSNSRIPTSSRPHVSTRNSSSVPVFSLQQNVSGSDVPIINSGVSSFKIPKSTNSSAPIQARPVSRTGIPVGCVSAFQTADPRPQVKMSAASSCTTQAPGSTVQVTSCSAVPISNLSTCHVPEPGRFQVNVPITSSLPSQGSDPRFQMKFPVSDASTSWSADPRSRDKFSAQHLSTAQVPDGRLQGKMLNRSCSTVSHSSTKNIGISASGTRPPSVGVVVPQKCSRPELLSKLSIKLNSETFILNILHWSPSWMKEQEFLDFPPAVVDWTRIKPLKLYYENFDDYALSFYNLLLIEMWESLVQAWKEKNTSDDFFFVVTNYSESADILTLECESVLSETMSHYPVEGTLLIIYLRLAGNTGLQLFGYTSQHRFYTLPEIAQLHEELKKLPEAREQNPQYCRFKLQIKKKKLSVCLNKRMKGCVFSYISVTLRVINSLVALQSSPLIKDILCPQEKNCTISSVVPPSTSILRTFNEAQASAIIAVSGEVRKVYSVPRILLLQGPPGTGKTHVIIGIIENLLSKKHDKIKILVTAPSNAAADEIGRRLIALRRSQSCTNTSPLCFVRVGIPNQIHRDVSPFSLDSLVHATYKKTWNHEIEKTKVSLSEIETKMKGLKREIDKLKVQNVPQQNIESRQRELSMLERRARICKNDIDNLKNKTVKPSDPAAYRTKLTILKNADVILSTLSSCRQSILEKSFGKKSDVHFTCCIIDEASQCTEPEALQPLAYGMCKLLLVGDHQQLPPTVRSRVAVENHLDRSLFERIHLYFNNTFGRSPVYMLTEQYRMHSEICCFPSFHFYSQRLKTAPGIDSKYESFPLKPYFVLNIAYSKESSVQTSKANVLEADIIIPLCKALVDICPQDCSIGVITPYQGQKRIYESAFSRYVPCQKIEVNTVDSFQGREKDVIIISCVRANSLDGSIGFLSSRKRLNVAITRAAKCLIICGHTASLEEQPGWNTLIRDAGYRKLLIPVTSADDIPFILRDIRKRMF